MLTRLALCNGCMGLGNPPLRIEVPRGRRCCTCCSRALLKTNKLL